MKKIALISTGGTIASKVDKDTGKLMAGELTGEELLEKCNISTLNLDIGLTVKSLLQIPSNQMTFDKNIFLYKTIKEMEEEGYEGFVITHGTDTMEESAYFISLLWESDVPVVFTGSQFSPTENNTDAFHNISNSILVASSEKSNGMGVLVTFNDKIFDAQYVSKIHASNIEGFGSLQSGPLGIVDFGRVHYFQRPIDKDNYKIAESLPKVEIVKQYIDMDSNIIDFYISQGVKGLIIEGYGRGQTTLEIAEKAKIAVEKGIVVVITTTCGNGEVQPVYGYKGSTTDLLNAGVLNGFGYMPKKARIKLMLLLANGFSKEEMQKQFEEY